MTEFLPLAPQAHSMAWHLPESLNLSCRCVFDVVCGCRTMDCNVRCLDYAQTLHMTGDLMKPGTPTNLIFIISLVSAVLVIRSGPGNRNVRKLN